jgi:DNA-binding transcriptional LysR family regulator
MDKIQALKVFTAVVKANSFTVAADKLEMSPPMISRYVAWLEKSVGARLFNRTTRRISLTEAGEDYFRRTMQILDALEEADAVVAQGEEVRGTLRLTAPISFGENQLMPIVTKFMQQHAKVNVVLNLEDRRVNLVEEGYDLAIRITREIEPGLIARKLCLCRSFICASPVYLKRHGTPASLEELAKHECLIFPNFQRETWQFERDDKIEEVEVKGRLKVNNIDALIEAALAGFGLTHQPTFLAGDLIRAGKLKIVTIPNYRFFSPHFYIVYPSRHYLPPKVRAFISALTEWMSPHPVWDKELV